jgi:MFS family permease
MLATATVLGQFGGRVRRGRLLTGGLLGGGITLILIAIVPAILERLLPNLLIAFPPVFGFVGGVAFGMLFIPAFTILQEKTEPELRGRIFGALFTVVNAAVAIPILLAGELADLVGVTRVIFTMGAILILTALVALLTGRSPVGPVRNGGLSRL